MKNRYRLATGAILLCLGQIASADPILLYFTFGPPLSVKYNHFETPEIACKAMMKLQVGNRDVFEMATMTSSGPILGYQCLGRRPDGGQVSYGQVISEEESDSFRALIPYLPPLPTETSDSKFNECKKTFMHDQVICNGVVALTLGWSESVDQARSDLREGLQKCFENNYLIFQGCLQRRGD